MAKGTEFIKKIEEFSVKIENFFNNMEFIPRFISALGAGAKAFNDVLLKRTPKKIDESEQEGTES